MLEFMLDTNICIYLMHRRHPDVARRFFENRDKVSISSVVLAELQFGVAKSNQRETNVRALKDFTSLLAVLPLTGEAASHYADIRARLEADGMPVGPNDLLIGAHARSLGLTLVTNNRREFDRMPGLKVENWI